VSEDGSHGPGSEPDLVTEEQVCATVRPFVPGFFTVIYRGVFDVKFATG
jgi:hypothetical protein